MKNTKSIESDAHELDWTLLFQAFNEAFEWALDVAAHFARKYPAEVAAVERVRTFMRKQVAGQTAHVRIDDLLFTFGLIIGALERDLGPVTHLRPTFVARRPPLRANHTARARAVA
jgi:hypothetical protein